MNELLVREDVLSDPSCSLTDRFIPWTLLVDACDLRTHHCARIEGAMCVRVVDAECSVCCLGLSERIVLAPATVMVLSVCI